MIADLFPRIPKDEVAELESKIKQTASYKGFTQLTDRETREVIEQTYSYHLGIPDKAFHPLADAMWKKGRKNYRGSPQKTGYVYFARAEGMDLVKVGYARHPASRLETLQTGSPVELYIWATVPGDIALEKELHKQFAHLRSHGEWFRLSFEIDKFLMENPGARISSR